MEKYLQAQFVTIPHGFTLGFRSDTSKSFSVVTCSTFSWRLPARPAGLERGWCASGCFCWAAPGVGLFQMSFVMHRVYAHQGKGEATGGGVAVGLALYLLRIHIQRHSLSLWNTLAGSGHTHPLWIVAFSVSGSVCVNPVGVAIPSTCSFSTSFQVH